MTIEIIYFASLREQIGRDKDVIQTDAPVTVEQAWTQATGQEHLPEQVLMAVNHEYVTADAMVNQDDELAFFPPVTGG